MRFILRAIATWFIGLIGTYLLLLAAINLGVGRSVLVHLVNGAFPALHDTFDCRQLRLTPALQLRLTKLSAQVTQGTDTHTARVGTVYVGSLFRAAQRRRLPFIVQDAAWSSRALDVEGLTLQLDAPWRAAALPEGTLEVVGTLQAAAARFGQLAVNQLHGIIVQKGATYRVEPLTMQALAGTLHGSLVARLTPAPRVDIDIAADRLQLGELTVFNRELFRGAQGALNGTLQFTGTADGLASLQGVFVVAAPGGTIGAKFLEALLPYLPKTAERQRLTQAIAAGRLVPFQTASVGLTITDPRHVNAVLNMAIPEYNLLLDGVTIDVRLEDPRLLSRILELFGSWQ